MPHSPNVEMLMVAWIQSLVGIPGSAVATSLPADPAVWSGAGFVQVTAVAGSPAVHTPLRAPVVQVDAWANNLHSLKPPWNKASVLMETIIAACYDNGTQQRVFVLEDGFRTARLLTVYPLTEPRRVKGDESGFARLTTDLQVGWTVAA